MFTLVNSNDLHILSELCAEIMLTGHGGKNNPLSQERVIVMNKGMRTFMRQSLASSSLGIAAGVRFSLLWEFIWELHKLIHGADSQNRFARDYLTQALFALKDKWKSKPSFRRLRDYIGDDDQDLKAYELCLKLADTFDQYQMYRPDWILSWDAFRPEDFAAPGGSGGNSPVGAWIEAHAKEAGRERLEDNAWQIELWNLLSRTIKKRCPEGGSPFNYLNRCEVMDALCRHEYSARELSALPGRIFIIGVSALQPRIYDLLNQLSRQLDIFYMLLTPCREYWGDLYLSPGQWPSSVRRHTAGERLSQVAAYPQSDASPVVREDFETVEGAEHESWRERVEGNPLLLAYGREGMENLALMYDRVENINNNDAFIEPEGGGVLGELKRRLLTVNPEGPKAVIAETDHSLEIHSCHTVTRELEVLRDAVLTRFQRAQEHGEDLLARELLVMVPDIEAYAPYIEAVFGSAEMEAETEAETEADPTAPYYIPYAICDRAGNRGGTLADAVLRLLDAGREPLTASFVIGLLNVAAIAGKFGLSDAEVTLIADWCVRCSIHRGLSAEDLIENRRRDEKNPAAKVDPPWTFTRGLERLLDGYALGEDALGGACSRIEGADGATLGKFVEFIRRLKRLRDGFPRELSLVEDGSRFSLKLWFDSEILEPFFAAGAPGDERDLSRVSSALSKLCAAAGDFNAPGGESSASSKPCAAAGDSNASGGKISLPVLRRVLDQALSAERESFGYLREGLNFCSMVPMRAVPFRHIFILGLNDGSFPRREHAPGFNLLAGPARRRPGDRSQAADDRYIFLESLLAAGESLYLSYLGQSPVDQSVRCPSPVISELLDYIVDNFTLPGGQKLTAEEHARRVRSRLLREERLNAHDPRNFAAPACPGDPPPSFDARSFAPVSGSRELKPVYLAAGGRFDALPVPRELNVDYDELVSFTRNPAAYFLRHSLEIELERPDWEEPEDDEAFTLDHLRRGELLAQLIREPGGRSGEILRREKRDGRLPYGVFLKECERTLEADARAFKARIEDLKKDAEDGHQLELSSGRVPAAPCSFEIALDGVTCAVTVAGEVPVSNVLCNTYSGEYSPKRLLDLLVRALLLPGPDKRGFFLIDKDNTYTLSVAGADRQPVLEELVRLYAAGLLRPQPVGDKFLKAFGVKKQKKDAAFDAESFLDQEYVFEEHDEALSYLFARERAAIAPGSVSRGDALSFVRFYYDNVYKKVELYGKG